MLRGEIWWADLEEARGSTLAYNRPVLIVQSDPFNRSRIETVIVVSIRSNLELAPAPGNVSLPRRASGLPKESVANVSQIETVNKSQLIKKVGRLAPAVMRQVEDGIRLILEL